MARKDNRGRNLRTGESQRKDGLYMYRYKDERTGRRLAVYSPDLAELRKKEKEIEKDQSEGILTDTQFKNMTLNDLFEIHMDTRKLAESTQANYRRMWNSLVRNELGQMKVVQVRPSHVRLFYSRLSKQKYSHSTIKFLHNMILPSFEVAVDDDIIRKNPAKRTLGDYGEPEKKRTALSFDQQKNLGAQTRVYDIHQVFSALQQGLVNSQENTLPLIVSNSIHRLQKYLILTNHKIYFECMLVGMDFYDSLSEEEQKLLTETAQEMVDYAREMDERELEACTEVLSESGVETVELPDKVLRRMRETGGPVVEAALRAEAGDEKIDRLLTALRGE